MVLHNPNNWHWVSKDAAPWAKDWLDKELSGVSATEGDASAKIDKVLSMDGDVDVSQRKGKVIAIYDVKLQLEFSGKIGEDIEASGTITIPEVAYDTQVDEYTFNTDLYSETDAKTPIRNLVISKIIPQLREMLPKLGPALIAENAKDIQHAPGSDPSSGFSTPRLISSSSLNKDPKPVAQPTTAGKPGARVNVTTLTDSEEFRTTAEELFTTFTDPGRLAAFTRAPPKVFEGAKPGGKFELFGGNVSGEFLELDKPVSLVQSWRLAQWPAGHYSTLKIRFEQNNVDAVTVMRVDWEGVPVGQEEVTRRNWGEYYVRSIKTTFGFGTVL
ncbi:hypothetical protein EJ06DRAFT_476746 [Trichodelitschia bisporula]|uniref:Activator of Hsp90 ATPase AHSA1-like N-terminal domain-containing protein n=1 Tax=Trichodelitschia bisporula TaxID=703511 RepID=A0A6G1HYW5_9PEZI|nr:hypothetical protein EJ06DRAFT_476746 [Trichodelitschia bisporula]